MVHRAERIVDIFITLRKYKLEPKNIRFVHSKIGDKPNLVLVKAVKCAKEFLKIDKPLVIYGEDGNYTDEIYEIYGKKRD
jgi:tRNA1Val (adenine37-N6)-methyltransferase